LRPFSGAAVALSFERNAHAVRAHSVGKIANENRASVSTQ
jgi:hypothetical protein